MKPSKWCDCGAALSGSGIDRRCPACERRHRRAEPKARSVEARLADWREWHSPAQLAIEDVAS